MDTCIYWGNSSLDLSSSEYLYMKAVYCLNYDKPYGQAYEILFPILITLVIIIGWSFRFFACLRAIKIWERNQNHSREISRV